MKDIINILQSEIDTVEEGCESEDVDFDLGYIAGLNFAIDCLKKTNPIKDELRGLLLKTFEAGFDAGVFWESSEEAFAKTTREPYQTPKGHVNELFAGFLIKLEENVWKR